MLHTQREIVPDRKDKRPKKKKRQKKGALFLVMTIYDHHWEQWASRVCCAQAPLVCMETEFPQGSWPSGMPVRWFQSAIVLWRAGFSFLFLRSFLGVRVVVALADIPSCTAPPHGQPASLRKVLQSSENDECGFSGLLRRERQNTKELETTWEYVDNQESVPHSLAPRVSVVPLQ